MHNTISPIFKSTVNSNNTHQSLMSNQSATPPHRSPVNRQKQIKYSDPLPLGILDCGVQLDLSFFEHNVRMVPFYTSCRKTLMTKIFPFITQAKKKGNSIAYLSKQNLNENFTVIKVVQRNLSRKNEGEEDQLQEK